MAAQRPAPQPEPTERTDGRRARRERGRRAVIDAMIDLVFEGHAPPTTEMVAERAGVSVASLFRYFENLDDLRREAIHHYFDRFSDLFEIPDIGTGDQATRIATFVDARLHQYETTAPIARLTRARSFDVDVVSAQLGRLRATNVDQIRLHFAVELGAVSKAAADDIVATIASLTSFESWDQFTVDHDRSAMQVRRAWKHAIAALLS